MSDEQLSPTELDSPTTPIDVRCASQHHLDFDLEEAFPMYANNSCDGPSVNVEPMTMKEKFVTEMGYELVQQCAHDARAQRARERLNTWGIPIMTAGPSADPTGMVALIRARALARAAVQELPADIHAEAHSRLARLLSMSGVSFEPEDPFLHITRLNEARKAYYIGITERPAERWEAHAASGWKKFAVWMHVDSRDSAARERALIARFSSSSLQENISSGGGGASQGRPHFSYIVSR
jgi:hypothetical protein